MCVRLPLGAFACRYIFPATSDTPATTSAIAATTNNILLYVNLVY